METVTTNFESFKWIFEDEEHIIRSAGTHEEPLFCARDVCLILGIQNVSDAIGRLEAEPAGLVSSYTRGGRQEMSYISEEGLYELVFTSKKPIAKQFR